MSPKKLIVIFLFRDFYSLRRPCRDERRHFHFRAAGSLKQATFPANIPNDLFGTTYWGCHDSPPSVPRPCESRMSTT